VPNWEEQMVRYYGYYSNFSRVKRKKEEQDDIIPCIIEQIESSQENLKTFRPVGS